MIAAILAGLLKANLAAAAAILVVLGLRKVVRTSFGAHAAYALWIAPPLTALAALLPHPAAPTFTAPIALDVGVTAEAVVAQAAASPGVDWPAVAFAAWLAGALAVAALLIWRQLRFVASLGRLEPVAGASPRMFRASTTGVGPAVIGVLRPRIVAPADFERRFATDEQALILAHEHVHLAGGDAAINALACVAQCLGWFNPLAHLAARLLRIDQELACDAAVIDHFPEARRLYAELLLKTQLIAQPLPLGCQWPAGGEHPLKERITMLKSPPPTRTVRLLGVAATAGLSLVGACAAWSAQPGAPRAASALEPEAARKLAGQDDQIICKPDANRELHNCRVVHGSPWTKIATTADVRREYPPQALLARLTADVLLRCRPDRASGRLADCRATDVHAPAGQAMTPALREAFGAAAVRVAGVYRLRNGGDVADFKMPDPMYMVIQFNDQPVMPGGPPANPAPTHAPRGLPIPTEVGLVAHPDWAARPGPDDVARVYPIKADQDRVGGEVTLGCRFAGDGRLTSCRAESETPPEDGFAAAAMKLAPLFRAKPVSHDGVPVTGAAVRIPIRFMPPGAGAADQAAATAPMIAQPVWIEKPTAGDLARLYPAEAARLGVAGRATMACTIAADGRLANCAIVQATADRDALGMEFGGATLQLARLFRMEPVSGDGVRVAGGLVKIPVVWRLPQAAPPQR